MYSTSEILRSDMAKVNISFGSPQIKGKILACERVYAYYTADNAGVVGSPDYANIVAGGENGVVQVGPIFMRDSASRRHDLDLR